MPTPRAKMLIGALTGLVALIGMIRLAAGGFSGGLSVLAWSVILLAMVPWVGYAAWRARRGRLTGRSMIAVLSLDAGGARRSSGSSPSARCWRWPARSRRSW